MTNIHRVCSDEFHANLFVFSYYYGAKCLYRGRFILEQDAVLGTEAAAPSQENSASH